MSETLVSKPRHQLMDNHPVTRNGVPYPQNGGPYPQNGGHYSQNGASHEPFQRPVMTQKKSEITVADSNPMAALRGGGATNGAAGHVLSPKTAANIKEMVDAGADVPESLLYTQDTHMRQSHVAAHAGPTSNALLAGRRHAPIAHQHPHSAHQPQPTHVRRPSDDSSVISDISSNSKLTADRGGSNSPNNQAGYSVPEVLRAHSGGSSEGVALNYNNSNNNNHNNNGNVDYYRQSNTVGGGGGGGSLLNSPRDRPPIGNNNGGGGGAAAPLSFSHLQERQKQNAAGRNQPQGSPTPPPPYYQQAAPATQQQQQRESHRLHIDTPSVENQRGAGQSSNGASPYQTTSPTSPLPPSSGYYSTTAPAGQPQQQQQQHYHHHLQQQQQLSPTSSSDLPRPTGQGRRSIRRNSDSDSVASEASSIRSGHSNGVRYPPAYSQLQQQQQYPSPTSPTSSQYSPTAGDQLPRPTHQHQRRPSNADSVNSDTSSLRSGGGGGHHHHHQLQQQQQQYGVYGGQHHQLQYQNGYPQQQQYQSAAAPGQYYDDRTNGYHHQQPQQQSQQRQPYPNHQLQYADRPLPNPHYQQQQQQSQQQSASHSRHPPVDDVPRNSLGQRLNPEYRSLAAQQHQQQHEDQETDDDEYMTAHDLRRASGKLDFAHVYDPHAKETPLPPERPNLALDLLPLRDRVLNQRPQAPLTAAERLQAQEDSEKRHDWNRHNTVSMSKIYGLTQGEDEEVTEGMPEEGFSDKFGSGKDHNHQRQQQQQRSGPSTASSSAAAAAGSVEPVTSNLSQTTVESVSDRVAPPTAAAAAAAAQKQTSNDAAAAALTSPSTSEKSTTLCEYEPPPALSNITKAQQSREILYAALKKGLTVIKHGRYGAPKKKILTCDHDCEHLYWRDDNGLAVDPKYQASLHDSRGLKLSDVKQIRMGGEIDPTSIPEDYAPKRKTLTETLFGHHKDEGIKYGTATLRKHCKEADLLVSFSLIMNDRTFDIQCLNKKDYNLLYSNLFNIINDDHSFALLPKTMPPLPKLTAKSSILLTSPVKASESRKGRRKSVTFSDGQAAVSSKDEGPATEGIAAAASGEESGKETYSDKVAAAATAAAGSPMRQSSFGESESDKFNSSFTANEPVYELDESDNYDLLLQPLANYSSTAKKDTVHPAAIKGGVRAGGVGGDAAKDANYKGYKEYTKFMAELHDDYDDDDSDDEYHKESKKRTDMHTLLNSSQERIVISPGLNSRSSSPGGEVGITRISSNEAMEIGLLLSQQEALYGINMYDSLKTTDAPELDRLMRVEGLTTEKALLEIFNKRFDPRHQGLINMQNRGDMGMAPIATALPVYPNNAHNSQHHQQQQQMGGANQRTLHRMTSNEALQIGLMLSKQEAEYGTNMYESLTQNDDAEISRLCRQGFSEDEAVLEIFNRKYVVNYRGGRPGAMQLFASNNQQPQQQLFPQSSYATAQAVPYGRGGNTSAATTAAPYTLDSSPSSNGGMRNPRNTKAGAIHRMNSTDGMNLMLLISQQEAEHGTNMYDSMVPQDESTIMELMETGRYTHEQAVQALFEKRYRSQPGGIAINSPPRYPQQQQQMSSRSNDFSYLPPPPMAHNNANNNWQGASYNSNYSSMTSMQPGSTNGPPPSINRARSIQRIQSVREDSYSTSPNRNPQFFSTDVTQQMPYYGNGAGAVPASAVAYPAGGNNGPVTATGYPMSPPPLDPHMNAKMSSANGGAATAAGGSGRKGPREDLVPEANVVHNNRSPSPVVAVPAAASPGVPVVERKRSIFSLNKQKSGMLDGDNNSSSSNGKSIQYREKDVRTILQLGYVREQAVSALVECNNDVQRAIQLLAGN